MAGFTGFHILIIILCSRGRGCEGGIASCLETGCAPVDVISEVERRVIRGRQIVARQRDLVAQLGGRLPMAVALLRNFETTLAISEERLAADQRQRVVTVSSQPVIASPAATQLDDPADVRAVAHLMEILRQGGYACELAYDTLH